MRPVPRWFLVVCWVMAVLFMISVGLQENDPDPVRWMAIYGAAGLACAALPPWRIVAIPAAVIGLLAAVWGVTLVHQVYKVISFSDLFLKMSEKGGAVEVGREAGGLVIVAVFLLAAAGFRVSRA